MHACCIALVFFGVRTMKKVYVRHCYVCKKKIVYNVPHGNGFEPRDFQLCQEHDPDWTFSGHCKWPCVLVNGHAGTCVNEDGQTSGTDEPDANKCACGRYGIGLCEHCNPSSGGEH